MNTINKPAVIRAALIDRLENNLESLIELVNAAHDVPVEHCNSLDIALTDHADRAAKVLLIHTELPSVFADTGATFEQWNLFRVKTEQRLLRYAAELTDLCLKSHDFPVEIGLTATDIEITDAANRLNDLMTSLDIYDEMLDELGFSIYDGIDFNSEV